MRQYVQEKKEVGYYNLEQNYIKTQGQIVAINMFWQVNAARLISIMIAFAEGLSIRVSICIDE